MKDIRFKGFIFTLDAIFSLIVASAAVSILLYIHFVTPVESQSPVMQAQGLLSGMMQLRLGNALASGIIPTTYSNPYTRNNATGTHVAVFNGGSNTEISTAITPIPNTAASFTLSAWVYVSPSVTSGTYMEVVGEPNNAGTGVFSFTFSPYPYLYFGAQCDGNDGATTIVKPGGWYNIVGVYKSGHGATYVNGINETSGSFSLNADSTFSIGNGGEGCTAAPQPFKGYISNVQIYSTALQANAVKALYKEGVFGLPISTANLSLWYPLNGNANDYNYLSNGQNNGVSYPKSSIMPFGTYNASLNSTLLQTIAELYLNNESAYATILLDRFTNDTNIAMRIGSKYVQGLKAASFDGTNSYINTTAGFTYPHFTIAAWVKLNSLQNSMIETGYPINANHLLMVENGNTDCSNVGAGTGYLWKVRYNGITLCSTTSATTGVWQFVVGTYNGRSLDLYINGALNSHFGSAGNASTSDYETIGGCLDCSSSYYTNGSIADLQMYNTALTPSQVELLYLEGMGGIPINNAGLQAWYPLDGNAQDYSQNFNTGIAHNVNYTYTNYVPAAISGASQISKASVPMALREGSNITLQNVSLILWN
ncbi:LamG domain-containing protein [Candidatus Marsarchaeota archaeon]|nr:LamG domain-containing protein [Candidatus Marsarchaeota archaeon]